MVANERFDVTILGTGIGGTMLGSILARQGLRVLLIDNGSHPKFAIGESTSPETSIRLKLIACRYSVPEIGYLGDFHSLRDKVGSGSGVKRGFSFLYHHEAKEQQPEESQQFPTLTPPFGPDSHWFRQETDTYMLSTALKYGANILSNTQLSDLDFRTDGIDIKTEQGQKFFSSYLVDATGRSSFLSKKLGLYCTEPKYKTNTRSLFTHMVGVRPYDQVASAKSQHQFPYPFAQTTLHHLFKGGWIWIIPFNNHPDSTNGLCSVGLTLNRNYYPKTDISPEKEFRKFVKRFPSIERQFEAFKAVRPWISAERVQFSTKQTIGDNWALMPSAAGFIDPLFSGGLSLTCAAVSQLSALLLDAFKDKDFSDKRFADYETLVQRGLNFQDLSISSAYLSFSENFKLWNAWFRVWCVGSILGGVGSARLYSKYLQTKDISYLTRLDTIPYCGTLASTLKENRQLFERAEAELKGVKDCVQTPDMASNNIFNLLEKSNLFPPFLNLESPSKLCPSEFTLLPSLRIVNWYRKHETKQLRQNYGDFDIFSVNLEVFNHLCYNINTYFKKCLSLPKDALFTRNNQNN